MAQNRNLCKVKTAESIHSCRNGHSGEAWIKLKMHSKAAFYTPEGEGARPLCKLIIVNGVMGHQLPAQKTVVPVKFQA